MFELYYNDRKLDISQRIDAGEYRLGMQMRQLRAQRISSQIFPNVLSHVYHLSRSIRIKIINAGERNMLRKVNAASARAMNTIIIFPMHVSMYTCSLLYL